MFQLNAFASDYYDLKYF